MQRDSPIDVTAAVIERDGRYLIARRPKGVHLESLWEFPGGKREPGEDLEACLARELREELDIKVEVGPLWRRIVHRYPEKTVALHFFLCRLTLGEPRSQHGSEIAWVAPEGFDAYEFPAADAAVLEAIRSERPVAGE
jgi:mutator protein MutT